MLDKNSRWTEEKLITLQEWSEDFMWEFYFATKPRCCLVLEITVTVGKPS